MSAAARRRTGGAATGPRVLLCAPLRCEAVALRGATGSPVLRTGLGPWRSARRIAGVPLGPEDAPVLLGLGGGVGGTGPGAVVVADEIRDEAGGVRLPGAAGLAELLRGAGFPVLVGPVASTDHVVGGAERAALATTGVVAVDMESAAVARSAGDRLCAVVRVVVDTARTPLLHPRTADRGLRALLRLRRLAPAVTAWAASSRRCRPAATDHPR